MKMQAGKHADKNKQSRSRPTVKMQMQTANSNWNSTLYSALSKTPVSSSLPLALTLLLRAQCARGALCLCILCCNCVSRYKFQWALLCYALRSVVESREGRGDEGSTPRQKKKMRARILRARVCVCVAWVILFSIISFCYFVFYLICLHTIIRTIFYFCFIHVLALLKISTNEKQEHTNKKR